MKFEEITADEFRKFAAKSPYQSFMQTPEIAELRAKNGWTPYYLAVRETPSQKSSKKAKKSSKSAKKSTKPGKILAATLLVMKPTFLGRYQTAYAPGGPLLDLEDKKLATFFLTNLAIFAKSKNAYVLHIDPYYELIERDRDGRIVDGGFCHAAALLTLDALGFQPLADTTMPKYLFALDLEPFATPDDLFKTFKQNTRNLTRRAERLGVTIRELNREDLPVLKKITASTAERRHFVDQPLSYYETMYDLFSPQHQIKFLLAELPATSKPEQTPNNSPAIPLSVAMFMLVGNEVVYLYSGSDQKYMKSHNAQYLIQWHMLKYALEHGYARYNFYGLRFLPNPDDPSDPKKPDYGIYRFKKGFGGHVVELVGSFELPLNQRIYRLHRTLSRLKNRLTHTHPML